MSQPPARDLARELLAHELTGVTTPAAAGVAAERVFQRLSDNLVQWVGTDGSQALFARARALAQTRNEALRAVPPPARSALFLDGLAANAQPHDVAHVVEGAVTLLTALIELLTRLVGDDLALKLLTDGGSSRSLNRAPAPSPERTS